MTTIQDRIIKSFDKKFIRDDGLIDKYGYSKNGELDTTANLIKQFLIQSIKLVEEETRKEDIELSDKIEVENNTEFSEWRAFKIFRNTLRDKLSITNKDKQNGK